MRAFAVAGRVAANTSSLGAETPKRLQQRGYTCPGRHSARAGITGINGNAGANLTGNNASAKGGSPDGCVF